VGGTAEKINNTFLAVHGPEPNTTYHKIKIKDIKITLKDSS
jgi:hypothetical protein